MGCSPARSVIHNDPKRWRHRLRRHAVERAADAMGLVPAGRDEQVASRGARVENLIREAKNPYLRLVCYFIEDLSCRIYLTGPLCSEVAVPKQPLQVKEPLLE
jgi:hypothetical protein